MKYRIFRKTRNGKRDRTFTARFSGDGESFERGLGVTSKDAAEAKASQMLRQYERAAVGLAEVDRIRNEKVKPITEHVARFIKRCKSDGKSAGYIRKLDQRLHTLIDDLGVTRLQDLHIADIDDWLAEAMDRDVSPTTRRHYSDALRVFLADMQRRRYVDAELVNAIPRPSRNSLPIREQRPFTEDELGRLGRVDMDYGPVYVLMAYTGLRKNEMEQITVSDLVLDVDRPALRVQSHVGKSGRNESIQLIADAVDAAVVLRDAALANGRSLLIPGRRLNHRKLDAHLEAAGISKIDAEGRYVSFHSFRRTLADFCIRHLISAPSAQRLMRHKDIRLTMEVYARAGIDQTFAEASAIPAIGAIRPLPRPQTETTSTNNTQQCATIGAGNGGGDVCSEPATGRTRSQQAATQRDRTFKEWSRGESNPRADTAGTAPLRV